MDERIRDRIDAALKDAGGQYVEVHVEEASSSTIRYRARDLEEIGRGSAIGGNVRALAGGGWGFASFNDLDSLESKVRQAVEQARVTGGERVELAETPPVVDHVPPVLGRDPSAMSLAEKKEVLDEYAGRDDGHGGGAVGQRRLHRRAAADGVRELGRLVHRPGACGR